MRIIIFIAFCLMGFSPAHSADTLKLMTYNIRLDTPADGPNQWGLRSHKVVDLLRKYNPDVIGTQEALPNQVTDIATSLAEYAHVGVGRDDGKSKGEFCAIYYRKNMFEGVESGTFWLSKTPEIPGSKDWDAAITRVCTWVKLKSRNTGKVFLVFNTHFDHKGKEARRNSVLLLRKKIPEISGRLPFVLMGDFNFKPDEAPYGEIVNNRDWKVYDTFSGQAETACTFTGFSVKSDVCNRIDYIFLSKKIKPLSFDIIRDNDGTYYPSDHLPVMTKVKF